ncbi:Na-translocating system protein MpsC family protein [Planococcus donghaensis]|uniref:Na-translocating system protein MpsC family protein n=1 Tax=Planococcus donghaensis TaxID=414778 RepID=UPI0037353D17
MNKEQNSLSTTIHYIETFLEEHFGGKPAQLEITLRPPFLLVHLTGFLLPSEEILLEKGRARQVRETRDILVRSVKNELLKGFEDHLGLYTDDLYADWNLTKQNGLLIITLKKENDEPDFLWPQNVNQDTLKEIIILNSIRTQKQPDQTNFYWLNEYTLLIERIGVLVDIEKQLIQNGITEELRFAKRPLEYRIIELFNLQSILKSPVEDLFVDWNFQKDVSYMVLLLKRDKSQKYR